MAKDPAVLFYTSDFISGTLTMSYEQKGKYIVLLCLQHQQGYLNYEDMMNICLTYDERIFSKFIKNDDGFYYNLRMKEESDRRKKYSDSRRDNRKNICKSHDEHMETETETINVNKDKKNKKEYTEDFDKFWTAYPNKKDKIAAFKSWKKINIPLETILTAIIKQIDWRRNANGEFRPEWKNPATWLNNGSWDDELKTGGNNGTAKSFKANSYRVNNNNRELDPKVADECDKITAKYFPSEKATNGNT